jgi:hypothetical protein
MAMSKGCTVALIIFVVLVVIIVGAVVLIYMNMDKLMGKMVDKMEEQVLAHQPEGYTEEDIKAIMAELKVAMEEDRVGPEDMQRMAQYMTEEFDEQRSLELLNMIQEILGHPEVQEEEMPPDTLQAVPDSL